MIIKVMRTTEGDTFTEGKLYINDRFECYTIEDTDRKLEDDGEKVYGQTAIPRGSYAVRITPSNRFHKDLIKIDSVPYFTGIRIHSGNSSKDTDGCIIVGSTNTMDDDNWVGGSRVAYNRLHARVKEALDMEEQVTLEVV